MKATDKSILAGGLVFLVALLFWFMVLGPKRQQASELSDEAAQLQQSVDQQEAVADYAEQARKDFPKYYGRLVVLGKAVPDSADSASLLVQLSDISRDAGVQFRGIELGDSAGAAPTEPAAPAPSVSEQSSEPSAEAPAGEEASTTTTTTASVSAAPATEAAAATMPIGSTIGPAGLPLLSYDLTFRGHFFDTADFLAGLDKLIRLRSNGQVAADGRLMTIDGFTLVGDPEKGFPLLEASFTVSAYSTPSAQGLTLGATPTAPAPAPLAPSATPTSTVAP